LHGQFGDISHNDGMTWADRTTPPKQRPGTQLSKNAVKVYDSAIRSNVAMGMLDRKQALFQTGGEARNFIFRKKQWITLPESVWVDLLQEEIDLIEWVDHQKNRCFSIPMHVATQVVQTYDAGIGPRVGFPLDKVNVTT